MQKKKALELFPNNNEIKNLYNQIVIGTKKLNESISYSKTGLDYFKKGDHINAATSNYLIGNLDKAIEQINVVIEDLNPLNGKCEYIKALILIRYGDNIGACSLLQTSIKSGYKQAKETSDNYCNN